MTLKEREQVIKDLQEIVDNYSGSWQRFNVLDNTLALISELAEENKRLKSVEFTCGFVKPHKVLECPIFDEIERAKADTVQQMQTMIKEECVAGGIYPAFVARVVENVGKKLLEENK